LWIDALAAKDLARIEELVKEAAALRWPGQGKCLAADFALPGSVTCSG
jgi:hypothetical protein